MSLLFLKIPSGEPEREEEEGGCGAAEPRAGDPRSSPHARHSGSCVSLPASRSDIQLFGTKGSVSKQGAGDTGKP